MSAGTCIRHEFNHLKTGSRCISCKIWVLPDAQGAGAALRPEGLGGIRQGDRLRLVVARLIGREGSIVISIRTPLPSTTRIRALVNAVTHPLRVGRKGWVQVRIVGAVEVQCGIAVAAGDGVAVADEGLVSITSAADGAQILVFDLA